MDKDDAPCQPRWQVGCQETGIEEVAGFGGRSAPPQMILGIAAGAAGLEGGLEQDFSYEALAADADNLDNVQASPAVCYFQTVGDDGLSFGPSYSASYDPSLLSVSNSFTPSPQPTPKAGYARLSDQALGWPASQDVDFEGCLIPPLTAWGFSQPAYGAAVAGLHSLAATQTGGTGTFPGLELGSQGSYGPSNWNDSCYSTSAGASPATSFTQDVAPSFPGYSPSAAGGLQPAAAVDESSFRTLNAPYFVSLSRQPSQESGPALVVSPPPPSTDANAIYPSSSSMPLLHRPPARPHPFPELGDYVDVDSGTGSARNVVVVPSDLQSSPGANRTRSAGYAPSETDSNYSGYGPLASSQPQRLAVPTAFRSRRESEPSSTAGSPFASPCMDRSPSTQSPGPSHSGRSSSRARPLLHPWPQQDAVGPGGSGSGSRSGTGRSPVPLPRCKVRGKRKTSLPPDKRKAANKARNDRTVCITCKLCKIKCDHLEDSDYRCLKCRTGSNKHKKTFVCTQAYFIEFVQEASTSSTAQHAINHICADGLRRRRISLPRNIDIADLLCQLEELRTNYIIRVSQGGTHLYDLDLEACHAYLKGLWAPESHPFRKFINDLRVDRRDTWKSCVGGSPNPPLDDQNLCEALLAWNETPSRATYSLVSKSNLFDWRVLDPDRAEDTPRLCAAAQLARIVGRKLELAAYEQLQKALIDNPPVTARLLWDLGRIVMSLRRRVARWKRIGTGAPSPPPPSSSGEATDSDQDDGHQDDDELIARVTKLCRILYMYWLSIQRRLPTQLEPTGIETLVVDYPDGMRPVKEKFPKWETLDGFEKWMDEGIGNLLEAGRGEDC